MPHVAAQCLSADTTPTGHGHASRQKTLEENRKNERVTSQGIRLGLRCLSTRNLLTLPETSSASNRSPQTQKFNVLPTPPSATSAVFDSPQKSSPSSSSVYSTNALAIVQRANTPIAELEDTSLAYTYPELEDTSTRAIRSRSATKMSSYAIKSGNSTARSLISAVDQRFADYEAEIRFLRNSLAEAEKCLREIRKSLCEANEAADDSNHALDAAQEAIADRDYEIEIKKSVIAELEKDVKHCQKYHPPPAPPSKWRGSDGAVSRFNVNVNHSPKSPETTNSAAALSPSLIGRSFAASPKPTSEGSSTVSAPKTARSTLFAPSGAPSPSAGGNPFPQSPHRSQGPKPGAHTQLAVGALLTALSTAAGPPKFLDEASGDQHLDEHHVRKSSLEQLIMATNDGCTATATQKSQIRSRRIKQSSVSNPNLRDTQNPLSCSDVPALPPRLPMMSGGLGISEDSMGDKQEQKLRKKRGGLGDIFRRKDQVKDQGSAIVDDMVHAMEFSGV